MKKLFFSIACFAMLCGCTTLTRQEEIHLRQLKSYGITVDRPIGNYEKPASVPIAAVLNILPGVGNFYLGSGEAAESSHWLYGFLNFLFWPISPIWAVPEAGIDAHNINQRELVYYYQYDKNGKKELAKRGIVLE